MCQESIFGCVSLYQHLKTCFWCVATLLLFSISVPAEGKVLCHPDLSSLPPGTQHLSLSTIGTNRRLSRVLKSVHDRPLRIGVFGGSVSTGGGCPGNGWVTKLQTRLTVLFKCHNNNVPNVEVRNYAQGATGSMRAFFCYDTFTIGYPPDIVLLEYAINDGGNGKNMELLLRSLPQTTAVVMVAVYSMRAGYSSSQYDYDSLARYYDVPLVSVRDALWPAFAGNSTAETIWFSADKHHPSCHGHEQIAAHVLHFFSVVLNAGGEPVAYGSVTEIPTFSLPPLARLGASHPESYYAPNVRPLCELLPHRTSWFELAEGSTWKEKLHEAKPYISCTSPDNGTMILRVNCKPVDGARDCALRVAYTSSWMPMGKALLALLSDTSTEDGVGVSVSGFNHEWHAKGRQLTVLSYSRDLRVPSGDSQVGLRCTGTSAAADDVPSPVYHHTEFRVHGFVVI